MLFLDPSCELCGFFFENRKALASHARAHLRQFGVTEWCVNGSPIETLSAWIRSRPQKVLEMHRSYMQGSRSALKKVGGGGSGLSLDDYILGSWLAHFLSEPTGSPLLMKSTLCVNKTRITDDFNIYIQMILSCGSQRGH